MSKADGVVLSSFGLSEAEVAKHLQALTEAAPKGSVSLQAQGMGVQITVKRSGADEKAAWEASAALAEAIVHKLGERIFSVDGQSLEAVVLDQLKQQGLKLAVAESCTGGGLGALISSVPGASESFLGGVITYSDDLKQSLLGVMPYVLKKAGAVSKDTALAMTVGLARSVGADYNIAITGLAGPDGGSKEKPVGTVHIALAGPRGVRHQHRVFRGERTEVQAQSVQAALWLLYADLVGVPTDEEPDA